MEERKTCAKLEISVVCITMDQIDWIRTRALVTGLICFSTWYDIFFWPVFFLSANELALKWWIGLILSAWVLCSAGTYIWGESFCLRTCQWCPKACMCLKCKSTWSWAPACLCVYGWISAGDLLRRKCKVWIYVLCSLRMVSKLRLVSKEDPRITLFRWSI